MKVFFPKHIDFLKHLIITYVKTVHIGRLRYNQKMLVRHFRKVLSIMFCAVTACHFAILTITVHTYTVYLLLRVVVGIFKSENVNVESHQPSLMLDKNEFQSEAKILYPDLFIQMLYTTKVATTTTKLFLHNKLSNPYVP